LDIFDRLSVFPRVPLTPLPTPLEFAANLSHFLGGPRIFFKRDDLTALAFGGNKTRKLEFIMADAIEKKADVVVTLGGVQSNWARQTASAARRLGMDVALVLEGEEPEQYQGNLLLDYLMGCDLRFVGRIPQDVEDKEIAGECPITGEVAGEIRAKGRAPYIAPLGGATPLGNLGYVSAAVELERQFSDMGISPQYLALATGTGGTQAGLALGVETLGAKTRVMGLSISRHTRPKEEEISELCNRTAEMLGMKHPRFCADHIDVTYDYVGAGYGVPTEEGIEAIKIVAGTEGIILDPVYSGKAMAGVIDLVRRGVLKKGEDVVFLHTGGAAAGFAYGDTLRSEKRGAE